LQRADKTYPPLYDGEEFVVAVLGANESESHAEAERLRVAISAIKTWFMRYPSTADSPMEQVQTDNSPKHGTKQQIDT
jgi:GGDEF domain-containing protein